MSLQKLIKLADYCEIKYKLNKKAIHEAAPHVRIPAIGEDEKSLYEFYVKALENFNRVLSNLRSGLSSVTESESMQDNPAYSMLLNYSLEKNGLSPKYLFWSDRMAGYQHVLGKVTVLQKIIESLMPSDMPAIGLALRESRAFESMLKSLIRQEKKHSENQQKFEESIFGNEDSDDEFGERVDPDQLLSGEIDADPEFPWQQPLPEEQAEESAKDSEKEPNVPISVTYEKTKPPTFYTLLDSRESEPKTVREPETVRDPVEDGPKTVPMGKMTAASMIQLLKASNKRQKYGW